MHSPLLQRLHSQTAEVHDAAEVVALDRERAACKRQAGLRIERQFHVHRGLAVDLLHDLVADDDEMTLEPFVIFRDHALQRLGGIDGARAISLVAGARGREG